MNHDWNCSLTELCCRTLTLLVVCWGLLSLIRCAGGMDDVSSRKLEDNTVLPSERAKDIDYGNTK